MERSKILILGGGFAGFCAYINLTKKDQARNLDITIVNNSENFVFTPKLCEYITSEAKESGIEIKLRDIIDPGKAKLIIEQVCSLDLKNKLVQTTNSELSYDYLIIALGSTTNFYGIKGAEKSSYCLKNLTDVSSIKHSLVDSVEKNLKTNSTKATSVTIVGAGPRGTEMAAKISELNSQLAKSSRSNKLSSKELIKIELIDSNSEILSQLPKKVRQKALRLLNKRQINVNTGVRVVEVTDSNLVLSNGRSINSDLVIWVAGVAPVSINIKPNMDIAFNNLGQIIVDDKLRVIGQDNVFAIGDIAEMISGSKNFQTSAQVAVEQSKTASENIIRGLEGKTLKRYSYSPVGILIPLGRWKGVGIIKGISLPGPLVWLACKIIYYFRFPRLNA